MSPHREETGHAGGANPPRRRPFWLRLPGICLIALIRAYQYCLSPLFPPVCRFVPSCSQYAVEAVEKYGALRGGLLTLFRLARCHPFSRGGYDPVR